ncbi:helix-turn-helix protein [Isoptericola sp. CG 20/1183]|uniref:Helix-turn-helix protein n=1 Tax=Isoptericola halotolerans TaxID=300560 RepID=A0ABX5EDN0_9MICO|nr:MULTISPECIES: helix-turn-helix transcriptional regulator [Isoptericola]PRZ06447.1 helix-turn-helix protein [Isoptericola halotolerans]PRZ06747.1 helix-turn-helix protein [Isoptericola sp. CG 20/1183]
MSDETYPPREPLLRSLVGAILRRARLRQGRTLAEVAAAARMSTAYLSEVERGRKEASSEVLASVCGALGIGLVDLVGDAHLTLATVEAQRGEARVLKNIGERGVAVGPAAGAGPVVTTDAVLLAA